MSSKRKRIVLTMADKVQIINLLKKGESRKKIAERYGVGAATISDIKKNSESILQFVSALESEDNCSRKTMKMADNDEVDKALYKWFIRKRSAGQQISGPILCEKALMFNKELGGNRNFKASSGWLRNFKSRHGIREFEIQGEKLSAHKENTEKFIAEMISFIEIEKYDPDFIYNAVETGLNWKALPQKTLAAKDEFVAPGYKINKDRVTIVLCANSSGKNKLNILLVSKPKCSKDLKSVKKLPVTYMTQTMAWMTTDLFVEWYDKTFIPEVKKYQETIGKFGKVLLIVDSAPSHPCSQVLEREDGGFKVMFIPPNVTPILQPMDQGIIETLKKLYRKELLKILLLCNGDVLHFYKSFNLKECVYVLADSWSSIKAETLHEAWGKLFGKTVEVSKETNDTDLLEIIINIPGCSECGIDEVTEWMKSDTADHESQILPDQEIVDSSEEEDNSERKEDKEENDEPTPSHSEALSCLEKAMRWYEKQDECNAQQLLMLRCLRDLAARKQVSSSHQTSLLDLS